MRQFSCSTFSQHLLMHFPITRGLRPLVIWGNASTRAEKKLNTRIASCGKATFSGYYWGYFEEKSAFSGRFQKKLIFLCCFEKKIAFQVALRRKSYFFDAFVREPIFLGCCEEETAFSGCFKTKAILNS